MSRIAQRFTELRRQGRKGFIPFVTAGDPDLETSLAIIRVLGSRGADVIELGVPFSDPMADGPTIQASSQRALKNGTRLEQVLDLVQEFRAESDVPVVLFSYLNPLMQYGFERLVSDASAAGVDGVLITDVIDDEAGAISDILRSKDLDLISLVAPTTSEGRLGKICSNAGGFIYAVARAGVTGARSEISADAEELVRRTRNHTDLPIAVGFGISTAEQVEQVWQYADAAVVGSAIVAEIADAQDCWDSVRRVSSFLDRLLPVVAKTPVEI